MHVVNRGGDFPSSPLPPGSGLDLEAVSEWLRARFAMLEAPDILDLYVDRTADTAVAGSGRDSAEPGTNSHAIVTVKCRLRDDVWIHVSTTRLGSTSPESLAWHTTVDYLLARAGRSIPWRGGPPPLDMQERLSPGRDRGADGSIDVLVDRAVISGIKLVEADLMTERAIVGCGVCTNDLVIAIVGPEDLVSRPSVITIPR